MRVEMKHGLSRTSIRVKHSAIPTVRYSFRACDLRRHQQNSPEGLGIFRQRQRIHVLPWHHQNVHRRLRVDISKCDAVLVFGNDLRRDFLPNDSAE
jgi:hypothetical protein